MAARALGALRARAGSMGWLLLMSSITLFGAVGVVVNVNQLRLQRLVAREMRALLAVIPSSKPRPTLASMSTSRPSPRSTPTPCWLPRLAWPRIDPVLL